MSNNGFIAARTVAQAIVIPPLLFVLLESFRSAEVNCDDYCGSPLGEVVYVQNFLRPFVHVIRSAIPSTVCGLDNMPLGCASELEKYVVAYLERAAILYTISFEVSRRSGQPMNLDPSVYWCLSQAITFDYFLGKPTYGYVPDVRELINNWACENALLEDGIEQTQNFGQALEKSAMPVRQRPTKQLSRPELVVLWIHRACHLAQDLHHTTRIAIEEETPEETIGLICDAVSVLLKKHDANTAGYFVPPEGTTLFGMAEQFVDLYGYHGDTSPFNRALMFDNLNTLFRTMADLEQYGIYEFIKPRQIARLSSEDPGTVVHQFGDRLLRYNPKLGNEARYQFPDPSREYAAMRPNTPVLSPVAEVADESMEEEEHSDKENESL
ncbi:hypothetical protein B0H14DRAFT_3503356 [Mycena olivaceomarginata]|nr:hypothetical protein B0H14DRAFT_3503356 [Mycena olivaceomarginata]